MQITICANLNAIKLGLVAGPEGRRSGDVQDERAESCFSFFCTPAALFKTSGRSNTIKLGLVAGFGARRPIIYKRY
ncbi:hypothetical protein R50072_01620 [Simiduia litorea]|uniref:hypothetical protein n=1 Tax=Simiduia litorea TaxID=1435348 RepID=UPI0036F1F689